ncbi:MAG: gamma-glutamyltransferase [Saprospiraceae bacterium]
MKYFYYLLVIAVFFIHSCKTTNQLPSYNPTKSITGSQAMVVAPHALASDIGVDILKQGGNAVDAAIAVQFAIAVVYPRAGNIGGGGFMVIRLKNGETAALDYREKAPMMANRDMYLDSLKNVVPNLSTEGHLACGVPGTVAGMFAAHQKYGKLPMAKLIEPAIRLAKKGYHISESEANRLKNHQELFKKYNELPNPFIKNDWKAGDLLIQKELARTLTLIKEKGAAGFYEGETADDLVAEMKQGGGIITKEDLKKYDTKWRTPLIGNYKNYKVISMPPSSSGGVALLQMLEMVEPYPLKQWGFHNTKTIHVMTEAERRAYADRAEHLGDSDFYNVPMDSLLNENYLQRRMADFSMERTTPSTSIYAGHFKMRKETFETTHTSIVDAEGNAVSVTTTLNGNFGNKVWVSNAGFFLNNEMDDFSVKPGVPNQFGLIGAEANAIQPGKRMLSSMTPTIVEKDGKLFLVLGTPGGSTIITTVFQVFLNVAEFNMNLDDAVNAKRFHHQWLPDEILIEKNTLDAEKRQVLEKIGHKFREVERIAQIKAILKLPDGKWQGVADFREPDATARGY